MRQRDPDLLENELALVLSDALGNGRVEEGLAQALTLCVTAAESLCTGREAACKGGCPHCCVLNVSVLLPEALLMTEQIKAQWSAHEWRSLQDRLAHHRNWVRWMDDEERVMRRAFCPMLDTNGNCSVYPVRPLACRGVVSLDDESCRRAFDPIIDERDRSVPADLQRRAAYDWAFLSLGRVLASHGLDDRSIELGTGILAFADPGIKTRFISGERLPRELWD